MNNKTTCVIIPASIDKPIKLIIEDNIKVINNGNNIEIKKHLSSMEIEKLLKIFFDTTDIGMIDISDIKDDFYYCPTCNKILDLTQIDNCMNTPNEIIDYCLECKNEVYNLKKYK